MNELTKILETKPVIYVTRDIERALGFDLDTPGYYIISNATDYAKQVKKNRTNILLIDSNGIILDTQKLLDAPESISFINNISKPNILVFKNTKQIETICAKNNWQLLNPSAELASRVEEKISQIEWLGDLEKFLPKHKIEICEDIVWQGKKFILQFNRAHTGSGTILVESEDQLQEIIKQFPKRDARIAEFIEGPIFTNNNLVSKNKILLGNISYQITGVAPFTTNPFSTIGNDWYLPFKILNDEQKKSYEEIATAVAEKLNREGWRGLFGIDAVMDSKTGKIYLLEINARQPASTTFESTLQTPNEGKPITTFEAHLAALLDLDLTNFELQTITNGAQIIFRNKTEKIDKEKIKQAIKKLCALKLNVINYDNEKNETDLLRIQTTDYLMDSHKQFNELGEKIQNILKNIL